MKQFYIVFVLTALLVGCVSTGGGNAYLPLQKAVKQFAKKIGKELPSGSRVAIVAFESENYNLSDFIMEEITGALVDRGIEVADRQNLEYVYKELGFQMAGDLCEETSQSIGKFLGVQMVITGQLTKLDNSYLYRSSAIHMDGTARTSETLLTVRDDEKIQNFVAALANQTATVKAGKYGVSEEITPQTAGTFLDRGILFASRNNYAMAIEDNNKAIKLDPHFSAAYFLRGRALFASISRVTIVGANSSNVLILSTGGLASVEQAGVYEQVMADFTQALRLDQNHARIYIERGIAYNDKKDYDLAIADYDQAIKLSPHYAPAYNYRGNALFDKGDHDRAIADYDQAIILNPYYATAYNNRGLAYWNKGDYDRAIADYDQTIKLNPDNVSAYSGRGLAYNDKKDYDRAMADYDQAIALNPHYAIVYYNRGITYYDKKDYDKAIANYDQAIKLNPHYASAYNNRGIVYNDKKDYDKAIADYDQAIRMGPSASSYHNRGYAYYMKKDYDKAIADYDQAIRLSSSVSRYYNRGNAYFMKKDYDRAIADYEAVLRLDPNHAKAKANLEEARKEKK
jgi:tetratricopeptide (TPR) repeat protein